MSDYSKLTKDEVGKKLDEAKKEIEDLKLDRTVLTNKKEELEEKMKIPNLPLAVKLAKAMGDMGALAKDGSNHGSGPSFSFISEAAIKAAIRKLAAKYGFAIIPTKIEKVNAYTRQTKKGGNLYYYDVIQEFTITDGRDSIKAQMIGTGSDTGDKAVNKAVTIALKNFEKQLFNVSDQNDPDPDSETNAPTVKTVKNTVDWSRPENVSTKMLENYTVNYNNSVVNLATILKHVRNGNAQAKAFADTLQGKDAAAYVELDKRTMKKEA